MKRAAGCGREGFIKMATFHVEYEPKEERLYAE